MRSISISSIRSLLSELEHTKENVAICEEAAEWIKNDRGVLGLGFREGEKLCGFGLKKRRDSSHAVQRALVQVCPSQIVETCLMCVRACV